MSRLDLTMDKQLETRLRNLLNEVRNLKRRQIVGASSLVLKRTASTNTWDVNGYNTDTGDPYETWRVTFYPSIGRAAYSQLDVKWGSSASPTYNEVVSYDDPADVADDSQKSWIVGIIPNNSGTNELLYLKFAVRSTSDGYFTWTKLA